MSIGVVTDWLRGETQVIDEVAPVFAADVTVESITAAINDHVEAVARGRQYNSAAHLASYVASTVAPWQAEAQAFVAWRDQVWIAALTALDQVRSGAAQPPESEAEFLAGLPVIQWPEASE